MISAFTTRTLLAAVTVVMVLSGSAQAQPAVAAGDSAVQRLLDDYIGLYRKDALERWKTLFLPGFTASYTNDDGTVTTNGSATDSLRRICPRHSTTCAFNAPGASRTCLPTFGSPVGVRRVRDS
jgi:hypothetical protein